MAKINPQNVILLHHFRRFLQAAAGRGIDVAPLKGAHMLTSVYPPGEDRPMMDVDFLVRPGQFEAACELLAEQGFSRILYRGRAVTERRNYEAFFTRRAGDVEVIIEPHRHLVQPARHPIDHDALWARSTPSELDGEPCRRLAAEDHLLHAVIHLMTHRFLAPDRALRDLELLVRGGVDLSLVEARARRWRCRRATWLTLTLLQHQAPDLDLAAVAARLKPPALVRAALQALVLPGEGFVLRGLNIRGGQAVLWPLLLDGLRPMLGFGVRFAWIRLQDLAEQLRER